MRRSDSKSSSSGFSSFMWKLKSSSHKLNKNIPEIKICPCQVDLRDEEDMEEEMIQRGKEARMVRERLLSEGNFLQVLKILKTSISGCVDPWVLPSTKESEKY